MHRHRLLGPLLRRAASGLPLSTPAAALSCCSPAAAPTGLHQSRCSGGGAGAGSGDLEHLFVGAYTPVTRRLWHERLQFVEQQECGAGALPLADKPPQVTSIEYEFTRDKFLKEMYRNPWGFLRMGRLMEDLDSLAGSIAFQHCYTPGMGPPLLVTAAVDAIEYSRPAVLHADMSVRGQVVFTGGSSLDIRLEMLQEPHAPEDPSLVALFSFVLLDPATRRPTRVPQLVPTTPQERQWAAERAAVAAARKAARQSAQEAGEASLPPAAQRRLDDALAAAAAAAVARDPLAAVAMSDTGLSNAFVTQPQHRNMHGRVFGGFLMRRAFELAFATTYQFAGSRPVLVRVDDITFRHPVDIGSLLRFSSRVVDVLHLAGERTAQLAVEVDASVSRPEAGTTTHTNMFTYVFSVSLEEGQRPLRRVLPATAEDADRLRRFLAASEQQ